MPRKTKRDIILYCMVAIGLLSAGAYTIDTGERESEATRARFRQASSLALRNMNIAWWQWTVGEDTIYWSDGIDSIYGMEHGTQGSYDKWLGMVHDQDRVRMGGECQRVMNNGGSFLSRYRIIDQTTGETKWVTDSYAMSDDGSIMVGMVIVEMHTQFFNYLQLLKDTDQPVPGFSDLRYIPYVRDDWGYFWPADKE